MIDKEKKTTRHAVVHLGRIQLSQEGRIAWREDCVKESWQGMSDSPNGSGHFKAHHITQTDLSPEGALLLIALFKDCCLGTGIPQLLL